MKIERCIYCKAAATRTILVNRQRKPLPPRWVKAPVCYDCLHKARQLQKEQEAQAALTNS